MSSMTKNTHRLSPLVVVLAALALVLLGAPGAALAVNEFCDVVAAECQVTSTHVVSGAFTIDRTLHIFGTGKLDVTSPGITIDIAGDLLMDTGAQIEANDDPGQACNTGVDKDSACPITLHVTGNMEMQAGSSIVAENRCAGGGPCGGGDGGNITITVGGDFTMRGSAGVNPGALISSRKITGAGDTGVGGDIFIKVGNVTVNADDTITCADVPAGSILMEAGSTITADAQGEAGAIKMFAGKNVIINGTVSSRGFTTVGRGGPITIDACCDLVVGPTGVVSSRGQDPGADLVHLQGCDVVIQGLVESTGPGHGPFPPANLCNDPNRPGKPANSTGCVEIWSGTTIVIDATNGNHGQVNADIGNGGTGGTGWIDILAHKAITIAGDTTAPAAGTNNDVFPAYAVHANMPTQNGHGGTIAVISTDSTVTTSGRAIQANSSTTSNGGKGGHITVLASGTVAFGTAFIQAAGDTTGGGSQAGGTIFAHSFNAKVTGAAPGQLNATGPGGTVTLEGCLEVAADYGGTVIGTKVIDPTCSGGTPPLPAPANAAPPVGLPSAECATFCLPPPPGNKTGVKFNDLNKDGVHNGTEPGLIGWEIRVYDSGGNLVDFTLTQAANVPNGTPDGFYSFLLDPGTYTVCEVLQTGWTQSAPCTAADLASCTGTPIPGGESIADCTAFGADLGPRGYLFTISAVGDVHNGNDFGNFQELCPKEAINNIIGPVDAVFTIDPSDPHQIQHIIDNALVDQTILILPHLGKKTENIVINKRLRLFGCSITLTAADSSQPVVSIARNTDPSDPNTGANAGLTMDIHATGSTVAGHWVDALSHTVRNVRSFNNDIGVQITGNSNLVNGALGTDKNRIGFKITGDKNTLNTDNGVTNSLGDGVQVAGGTGNTVLKIVVTGSGGNGFFVSSAASNTSLQENKAYSNGLNGYLVQGANTTMSKNIAGDIGKGNNGDGIRVDSNGGPLKENTSRSNGLVGFRVTGTGHTLTTDVSGGTASQNNGSCQFVVGASNTNGGTNKASNLTFTFGSGGANFPAACVPAALVP